MIKTRIIEPIKNSAWDDFVRIHPQGTFLHLSSWAPIISSAFKQKPLYLIAEQGSEIVGVLPLIHMSSALFGSSLSSTPFCAYGGPLVLNPEAGKVLIDAAEGIMRSHKLPSLELKFRDQPMLGLLDDRWLSRPGLYVTFRKSISGDADSDMKSIPRDQRRMVRKGIQNGLTSRVGSDVDTLFQIYSESVRNLGTPVFPKKLFKLIVEAFGKECEILVVEGEGKPVSAVMNFKFRDEIMPYYGGSVPDARRLAANDFMYWEIMRRSGAEGFRVFDFGRSKEGTGSYSFKKNWGFKPTPLEYRYLLAEGASIPEKNPNNPKYKLMIQGWKKLPLPIANFLGPFIVRGTG
jgi:FemAB-related protein (PEP-CTERM system-associated)